MIYELILPHCSVGRLVRWPSRSGRHEAIVDVFPGDSVG